MTAAAVCDTTPMKPMGRPVVVPESRALVEFGALTGTVALAETGDALTGAGVGLIAAPGSTGQSQAERPTDSLGGFTFDSILPGKYQIRVRMLGARRDSLTIHAAAGRLDTVRLRMRAYRCSGY